MTSMSEEKKYSLGFIVGRFQLFHKGHLSLVEESLYHAKKTVVLIGSSDKSRTKDNPFTYEERKDMIQKVFPECHVLPLPDIGVGNVPAWGDYMIRVIETNLGRKPDLNVSGKESKVDTWFSEEVKKYLTIEKVDRGILPISASQLRSAVLKGDKETFDTYMPQPLHSEYDNIRKILLFIESSRQ